MLYVQNYEEWMGCAVHFGNLDEFIKALDNFSYL